MKSRYHQIDIEAVEQEEADRRKVKIVEGGTAVDHDFVLEWRPTNSGSPHAAYFVQKAGGSENYGLLMVLPPSSSAKVIAPSREITYVIDSSGSMAGESFRQAVKALAESLKRLRPSDTFNIMDFDHETRSLFDVPQFSSPENVVLAEAFIRSMSADGGTEIMSALEVALPPIQPDEKWRSQGRLQQTVLITDGAVGNEAQLFRFVNDRLEDRRLFTVGIGSAPNSYFMRKISEIGRGTYTYIGKVDEVQELMTQLFEQMEQAVVTDLEISFEGKDGQVVQTLPDPIPDLYRGEPISVSMKMQGMPVAAVLSGTFQGNPWRRKIELDHGGQQAGLDVLFGRRLIEHWMDRAVIGESEDLVRNMIIQAGHRYHLVSKYTSLVAVDVTPDYVRHELDPLSTDQKTGGQYLRMAQTATPSELHMLLGVLLMALSLLMYRRKQEVLS